MLAVGMAVGATVGRATAADSEADSVRVAALEEGAWVAWGETEADWELANPGVEAVERLAGSEETAEETEATSRTPLQVARCR
jgi:hypothetical protein